MIYTNLVSNDLKGNETKINNLKLVKMAADKEFLKVLYKVISYY
jgi:hypothetical protein